jgi:hypothetical protein
MTVLTTLLAIVVLIAAVLTGYVQYRTSGPPKIAKMIPRAVDMQGFKYRKDPTKLEVAPALRAKTCAVTGAAGFLASHVIENLLRLGELFLEIARNPQWLQDGKSLQFNATDQTQV